MASRFNLKEGRYRWIALGGCAVLSLVVAFGAPAQSYADTIYLKNGRTVEGVVDRARSDDTRVFIRTPSGTIPVPRANIERVEIRENADPNEVRGDLAAQEGDLDNALDYYLRAFTADQENEALKKKIEDIKSRIRERDERKFQADFERIDQAISNRNLDDALELAKALAEKPGEDESIKRRREKLSEVYLLQARDFRNRVDFSKAEQAYRNAIKADPGAATAQFELAEMVAGYPTRKEEAYEMYRRGFEMVAEDPTLIERDQLLRYRYNWAEIQLKGRNNREAARSFWTVVENDKESNFPNAIDQIISAYTSIESELVEIKEENEEPLNILKSIAEMRQSESKARFLLGRIYFKREDYDQALPWFEQAHRNMSGLVSSPELTELRFSLAICYRQTEQNPKAVGMLIDVLREQPSRYAAICELGEVYYEISDYQNALIQFSNAVRVEPTNYRAYLIGGRTLRAVKKYEDALKQYKRLFELRDEHPDYLYEMGLIYVAMENHDEARDAFTTVLEMLEEKNEEPKGEGAPKEKPKYSTKLEDIYVQLGLVVSRKGGQNEAIEYFNKALAITPDNASALEGKGYAYEKQNDVENAEKFFQLAMKADPTNPVHLLNIGRLYHNKREDTKTALQYYMKYYEQGGTDPQVKQWIKECGGTPPV